MTSKPKILCVGESGPPAGCPDTDSPATNSPAVAPSHSEGPPVEQGLKPVTKLLREQYDVIEVHNPLRALARLTQETYAGMFVVSEHFGKALRLGQLLQNERILEGMPDGVVLLDADSTIFWANSQFQNWAAAEQAADSARRQKTNPPAELPPEENGDPAAISMVTEKGPQPDEDPNEGPHEGAEEISPPLGNTVVGANFYASFGSPEILGPDFCPFHTALATGEASTSTLRVGENHFYQIHAAPAAEAEGPSQHLIVTVRDVTDEILQQQKLAAIHQAGIALADLTTEEVFQMEIDDRIELLKSNILHYTKDLLNFDVVEIRLLDHKTEVLEPLLSVGLKPEAQQRSLLAKPERNGVTGFVAATGKSYLCEDTTEDPLYIEGCENAKSSLTVPLILHDQVIGTFNVESPEPGTFTESDLQFLEIFSRDVAVALNTLELLVAQKANTAQESAEMIHSAVALPIDQILNDSVNIMERYIGHEPEVVDRLRQILKNARDIKQMIQKVGQSMTPSVAVAPSMEVELAQRHKLLGRRVLVADADESVRNDAHALLERYGCTVETAHHGGEALYMVRNCGYGLAPRAASDHAYHVIIADIRLPDMSGFELLTKLKEILTAPPLVLMTGFGYDPGHSIVKARQAGLHPKAVLYKPFRLDQLLETVEMIIELHKDAATDNNLTEAS